MTGVQASDADSLSSSAPISSTNTDSLLSVAPKDSVTSRDSVVARKAVKDSSFVPLKDRRIYGWHSDGALGFRRVTEMDTTMDRFYINNHPLRHTINLQTLGNLGSPSQSAIFADRANKTDFLFFRPYQNYYKSMGERPVLHLGVLRRWYPQQG